MSLYGILARSCRGKVGCLRTLYNTTVQRAVFLRPYSEKYLSINEFNKHKKEFLFGAAVEGTEVPKKVKTELVKENDGFEAPQLDLLDHPRLQGLTPNSAEFKYQLHLIQKEFQAEQEKQRTKWEFMERIKGMAVGIATLVSIMSVYLFVMNYKQIQQWYKSKFVFDIDDSKVQDLNDPKGNLRTSENMVERMAAEIGPEFMANLKDSKTSGIYVFGAGYGKLPSRIPGFDNMYFTHVLVNKGYIVAVDDSGRVFHYSSKLEEPVKVTLPSKIQSVVLSSGKLYYLSKNGDQIYVGDRLVTDTSSRVGWFRSGVDYPVEAIKFPEFARGETIKELSSGENHLLILSTRGRVFEAATTSQPTNLGQFGLPKYSPYATKDKLVANAPYELTNLNNEVVASKLEKYVKPRTFISIAAGKYFNIACESNGNVWTWGDNSSGQCGKEVGSASDVQQVPKMVYSAEALKNIVKYSLPDKAANGPVYVKEVFASDSTAFALLKYEDESAAGMNQDLLVSFGCGLKGQLGLSRYIHANSSPKVLKSLVGMGEYDEIAKSVVNVGLKAVSTGNDHVFVTLDNSGPKDVLVFGDNERGQFGNGKSVKSSKPIGLPKLVEPSDLADLSEKTKRKLARKLNDQVSNRLQLLDEKEGKKQVEQVVVGGNEVSAIFYRKR